MTLFHVLLVLAVVGLVAAVATGRVRGGLPAPTSTRPELDLPSGPLAPEDVDTVRFSVGLRGYRMDEVDAVLDRLSSELGESRRELAELREQLAGGPETLLADSRPLGEPEPLDKPEPLDEPEPPSSIAPHPPSPIAAEPPAPPAAHQTLAPPDAVDPPEPA